MVGASFVITHVASPSRSTQHVAPHGGSIDLDYFSGLVVYLVRVQYLEFNMFLLECPYTMVIFSVCLWLVGFGLVFLLRHAVVRVQRL